MYLSRSISVLPGIIHNSRPKQVAFRVIFLTTLLFSLQPLFCLGTAEGPKQAVAGEKGEAVVYVCDVDVSQMPSEQRIAGARIRSALVQILTEIGERNRSSVEIDRYKDSLWQERKNTAAKALSDARNNRDMLLFKGYSKQKYESELAKITVTIHDLEKKLDLVSKEQPTIAEKARLVLHKDTANGTFAPEPKSGDRRKFCQDRGIDLLITSSLRELYGRWVLSYGIYRSVDDTVLYFDTVAFAPEELASMLPNLASALYQGLSGSPTGAIKITAQPESAEIVVDETVVGRGTTPVLEGPPGSLSVYVTKSGYYPASFSLDRMPNTVSTARISLSPLALHSFEITSPLSDPLTLYIDGLYRGEAPLTLEIPQGRYTLQVVKGAGNNQLQSIPLVLTTQDGTLVLPDQYLQSPGEKPVEKARKQFYGAFGRFWIALPMAFLLNGIANTYINAINYGGSQNLMDPATKLYYSSQAAWVLTGVFLGESLYRLGSYVYIANRGSSPVVEPKTK